MATKQFLEEGEWVGYEWAGPPDEWPSFVEGPFSFCSQMTEINFQVKSRKRCGAVGIVAPDASDDGGPFALTGVLYPGIGCLFVTKKYHEWSRPKYTFSLALTPFGLIGTWTIIHRSRRKEYRGCLWLWKRSWGSDRR